MVKVMSLSDSPAGLLLTDILWQRACSVLPSLALLSLAQVLNTTVGSDHQNCRTKLKKAEDQKQRRHAFVVMLRMYFSTFRHILNPFICHAGMYLLTSQSCRHVELLF